MEATTKRILTSDLKNEIYEILESMNIYIGGFKDECSRLILDSNSQLNDIKEAILESYKVETEEYNINDKYRFLDYICNDILEIDGYIYSDECFYCEVCSKYEFNDNGYFYNYSIVNDCEILCNDCLKDNINDYIDEYINNSDKAIPFTPYKLINDDEWIELDKVYDYKDTPSNVLDELNKIYDYIIFYISYSTPFKTEYKALAKNKDY